VLRGKLSDRAISMPWTAFGSYAIMVRLSVFRFPKEEHLCFETRELASASRGLPR